MLMGLEALVVGLASCGPLIVEQAADGAPPVDKNPTTLFEDTSNPEVVTAQPGEIPLQPSVITGSLVLEPAQAYSDAVSGTESTNTPEPYVPDNYSVYAQARGLDVPSNVNPEVDTQFRAFYNYIFNQQFEITNADGTVTTGSLLSASNPEINIHIAPDGTPYVKGTALDNDPAFGGGDHHFVMIWDISAGTIASLRISKQIGEPFINGYGNYTAQSPDGRTYSYNPVTNIWESNSPIAATLAPTALPTEAPVPTSTVVPAPIFTVTPPPVSTISAPSAPPPASQNEVGEAMEGYTTIDLVISGETITAQIPSGIKDIIAPITEVRSEIDYFVTSCSYLRVGDSIFIDDIPLLYRTDGGWVYNEGIQTVPNFLGLGPALYTLETLTGSVIDPMTLNPSQYRADIDSYPDAGGGNISNTRLDNVVFTEVTAANVCVLDIRTGRPVHTGALSLTAAYNVVGTNGLPVYQEIQTTAYGALFYKDTVRDLDTLDVRMTYSFWYLTDVTGAPDLATQINNVRANLGLFYNFTGMQVLTDPTTGIPGFPTNVASTIRPAD